MANQIKDKIEVTVPANADWIVSETTAGITHKSSYANIKANLLANTQANIPVTNNARMFQATFMIDDASAVAGTMTNGATFYSGNMTLATGNIILRNASTDKVNNGLWVVQATGAAVRYDKANTALNLGRSYTFIRYQGGTSFAGNWYYCTNAEPNIGTDDISFEQVYMPTKTQLDNKQDVGYASIYVNDGTAIQSIPTGTTYTKVTAYTTNGLSANCTADVANDKITITVAGVYKVNYTASYTSGTNNVTFSGAVFVGGVEQGNIHSGGQMGLSGAMRSTSCCGFVNVTSVPADIDVRIRHDQGGSVDITHVYANLNVEKIG